MSLSVRQAQKKPSVLSGNAAIIGQALLEQQDLSPFHVDAASSGGAAR
jgi:hypothetical protein